MRRSCSYDIALNHSFAPVKDSAITRNSSAAGRSCLSTSAIFSMQMANQGLLLVTHLTAKMAERGYRGVATIAEVIERWLDMRGRDKGLEKAFGQKFGQPTSGGVKRCQLRDRHDILSGGQPKSRTVGCRDGQLSLGPDPIWKHSAENRGEGRPHQVIKNISRIFHKQLRQRAKYEIDTTHAHANTKDEKSRLSILEISQHCTRVRISSTLFTN
jgi:hypothetical protein